MKISKNILRKIIREEIQKLTEAAISFDEMFDAYGFSLSDSDEGVKFYLHSKAKLDGFAEGNKLASVGRMSGKDNKKIPKIIVKYTKQWEKIVNKMDREVRKAAERN